MVPKIIVDSGPQNAIPPGAPTVFETRYRAHRFWVSRSSFFEKFSYSDYLGTCPSTYDNACIQRAEQHPTILLTVFLGPRRHFKAQNPIVPLK